MVDDDDGDRFPSPEPRTDSRSALPRGFRAWRRLRIVKRDESFSLNFSLPEHEYMELELRSVEHQGAHEAGGAPRGVGRAPTLVARVWAPSGISSAQYFLLFPKITFVEFQDFWSCAEYVSNICSFSSPEFQLPAFSLLM